LLKIQHPTTLTTHAAVNGNFPEEPGLACFPVFSPPKKELLGINDAGTDRANALPVTQTTASKQ